MESKMPHREYFLYFIKEFEEEHLKLKISEFEGKEEEYKQQVTICLHLACAVIYQLKEIFETENGKKDSL